MKYNLKLLFGQKYIGIMHKKSKCKIVHYRECV